MSAEIATDYQLAERVALALAPLPGLAAVLLGGVGDDWLRAPAYPYAVVAPSEAESARGSTTRTIRVRLVVRAADAASKPDPQPTGLYTDWTFADGLLDAAQANLGQLVHSPNHLEFYNEADPGVVSVWLVPDDGTNREGFAGAALSADGLAANMVDGADWALAVVPPGEPVATRAALSLLRVGAGPALDALVQAARDALSAADLGAPLESIATEYDAESQFPVQTADLVLAFTDAQAFGDAF